MGQKQATLVPCSMSVSNFVFAVDMQSDSDWSVWARDHFD